MATTGDYLTQLQSDKQILVNNLKEKGVEATNDETFTSLVPKVLDISSGGAEITKGFRIDNFDENGFATEITLIGFTSVPSHYFYAAGYQSGSYKSWAGQNGLKINLPKGLTSIEQYAFYDNDGLVEITLPDTLTSIGQYAFYGCKSISKLEIPSGVTSLPYQGFYACQSITEVTCLGNITEIGNYCFNNCSKMAKLVMPNLTMVPEIYGTHILQNSAIAKGNGYIYVPDGLVEQMKSANHWSSWANQIKGISEL